MNGTELAWRVEEACVNAWPSHRQLLIDGWLLRAGGGPTRRTNSVNPLRGGPVDPTPIVAAAEAVYHRLGQPALFRVPDLAVGMDAALARLGYSAEGESRVVHAGLGQFLPDPVHPTELAPAADERWIEARVRLSAGDTEAERALRATLAAMALPHACVASLAYDGGIAGVALGAIDRDLLIVEAVVVDASARRQGHGRALLAALMRWAAIEGASQAALQVDAGNLAALTLYRSLGFSTELYRYHYRRAPSSAR